MFPCRKQFVSLAIAGSLIFVSTQTAWSEEPQPVLAPLNPDFIEWQNKRGAPEVVDIPGVGYRELGVRPSPIDRSHLRGKAARPPKGLQGAIDPQNQTGTTDQLEAAPATYDLRTLGWVTPVRDQGQCGSCWAFGTFGALESFVLKNKGLSRDFSENNLKNYHGFNWTPCDGGNSDLSTAYLARWAGPVDESDDPYFAIDNRPSPGGPAQYHLSAELEFTTRDEIKNAIMTYGAAYVSFYWAGSSYRSSDFTYYYSGTQSGNHAVTIVGWNDSKATAASTPGAWLIKNSWGSSWGDQGYFWISYADAGVNKYPAAVFVVDSTQKFTGKYEYDPLGATNALGWTACDSGYGAVIFTPTANENLKAIGFYSGTHNTRYTITVYDNFNSTAGTFSTSLATVSGAAENAGYHVVSLPAPVSLTQNRKFGVVIKFVTPGYAWPVPLETPISGYSPSATSAPGQSYVSQAGTEFTDLWYACTKVAGKWCTSYGFRGSDVCIKAFTDRANHAPTAISDTATIKEDSIVTINVRANDTDPDGNPLGIDSIIQPLHGTATKVNAGSVRYAPDRNYNGSDNFQYRISDGLGGTAIARVNITIIPVNDTPVVSLPTLPAAFENQLWTCAAIANDPENNTITWSLANAPAGMTINPSTGVITWTPGNGVTTSGNVTVKATDNGSPSLTGKQDFILGVTSVNDAPVITSTAPTAATEDVQYVYAATATDEENNTLTWSLTNAPSGMVVNASTGRITWTPGEGVLSSGAVTLTVADNGEPPRSASQTFTVTVAPVNDPPSITSTAITAATEDVSYVYNPVATDPENGTFAWTLVAGPTGMTINASTGALSWTPSEGVLTSGTVTIRVTDNGTPAQSATQSFTITVTPVNDAPVITTAPATTATEDVQWTYAPTATDAENGILSWALESGPAGMTINSSTGALAWTPGEGVLTSGTVMIRVTDNGTPAQSATQSFTIAVTPVNDAPVITTAAATAATEDVQWTYAPAATDAENGILSWTLESGPAGMTIDASTGAMSWTPGEGVLTSGTVSIRVTDDGTPAQSAIQSFTVTVTPINDAPIINGTPSTPAIEHQAYSYAANATDPENGTLTWKLTDAPDGMSINASTGEITWTPGEGTTTSGMVRMTVRDNGAPPESAQLIFVIEVTPVNDPPAITSTALTSATEHAEYGYTPAASDPENGTVSWSLSNAPAGMTISDEAGTIAWTPGEGVTSSGEFLLIATDNGTPALSDTEVITISVTPVNDPPTITSTAPLSAIEDVPYAYSPTATDPENNGLTWSISSAPAGMTIDPQTSAIAWTPLEGVLSAEVTVVVTDNGSPAQSAQQTFTITVTPVNDAPTATVIGPPAGAVVNEGSPVTITANANDIDGSISRVQFYDGTVLLGEASSAPFTLVWTSAAAGAHSLTAVAIDNDGASGVSAPVAIRVNSFPTVSITVPASGASFRSGDAIAISANSNDLDGTLSLVEFFDGGSKIGEDNVVPYEMSWVGASAESHTLTARATDNDGASQTSAGISISVISNTAPAVRITRPIEGSSITLTDGYVLNAAASDADGKITKVEFYQGSVLLYTDAASPFAYTWKPAATGSFGLTARAFDDKGATTTSAPVTVSVNAPGEYFFEEAGGTCVMEAENYSQTNMRNDTIAFQFGNTLPGFVGTGYMFTPDLAIGNSAFASSCELAFRVNINTPDTYYVAIRYRAMDSNDDAWVGGVNNVQKGSSYYNAGVTTAFRWTRGASLGTLAAGIQTVQVRRYENGMEIDRVMIAADSNSLPARNSTEAGPAESVRWVANVNPSVSITSPSEGALFASGATVSIQADATDSDGNGIAKVEFFEDGLLLGEDATAPYAFDWSTATGGPHVLTAKAWDNRNGSTVSEPVNITFAGNQFPTVSITAPVAGATVKEGFAATITAAASDPDGSIAQVAFFDNGSLIGTDNASPYQISWTPSGVGGHSLTAQATDDAGAVVTSLPVSVNAVVNQPPVVRMTRPLDGATLTQSDLPVFVATASDPDGKIARVEFYQGATLVGTDAVAAYALTWPKPGPAIGTYVLTAKAYDDNGAITISAPVTITINPPGAGYYVEQSGSCVVEAEHYSQKNIRSDTLDWFQNTASAGYSGDGYMTTPDVTASQTNTIGYSSEIAYRVNITTPGTYYFAARRRSVDTYDDHGYVAVNNVQKGSYMISGITPTWAWIRGGSLGTLAAGTQTIQIRRYDNGLELDRFMIATDSTMLPARGSADIGPDESLRQ